MISNNMQSGNASDDKLVVNDLLSFMTCKSKVIPKEKLLDCINSFYSRKDIIEAQKILLTSLPIKKSTRHGRRVKHPDNLVAVYDCIQLISKDDMPTFLCQNLNNVPSFEGTGSETLVPKLISKAIMKPINETKEICTTVEPKQVKEINYQNEMNEEVCRKEQEQMKVQISEMITIISELKEGFEKFSENSKLYVREPNFEDKNVMSNSKSSIEESDESSIKEEEENSISGQSESELIIESNYLDTPSEKYSHLTGLALLQKIIDEDDEQQIEEESQDESLNFMDDLEDFENYGDEVKERKMYEDSSALRETADSQDKSVTIKKKPQYDLAIYFPEKCPICKVTFRDNYDFNQHTKIHYTKGTFDCTLCDQKFPLRDTFIDHFVRCYEKAKWERDLREQTCNVCGNFYADQTSMINHKSFHSECRHFPCSRCSLRFFTKLALEAHIKNQHHASNKHVCSLCKRSFNCKSTLLTHLAIHSGARPFSCNICDYKGDTRRAVEQHVHLHGGSILKKYNCKECNFACVTKYNLFKHRLKEHRDPVRCPECGKKFMNPSAYKRHYDIHRNKKVLKCARCLYSTHVIRYLKKHIMSHNTNSSVICPMCYVSLKNKRTITIHLKSYCKKMLNKKQSSVHIKKSS